MSLNTDETLAVETASIAIVAFMAEIPTVKSHFVTLGALMYREGDPGAATCLRAIRHLDSFLDECGSI
jgi:hypothetical protein